MLYQAGIRANLSAALAQITLCAIILVGAEGAE
jgi:hypothetical protein